MKVWKPKAAHSATKDGDWQQFLSEVEALTTLEDLDAYWANYLLTRHRNYPESYSLALRDALRDREVEIRAMLQHEEMDREYANIIGT